MPCRYISYISMLPCMPCRYINYISMLTKCYKYQVCVLCHVYIIPVIVIIYELKVLTGGPNNICDKAIHPLPYHTQQTYTYITLSHSYIPHPSDIYHISPCHNPNSYHIQPSPHHIQYSQCQYSQHPYSQYSHTATQPIQPYRQYSQPRKYTHLPITMDHNTMADKTLFWS